MSSGLVSSVYTKLLCGPRPCLEMEGSFLVFPLFSVLRLGSSLALLACPLLPSLSSLFSQTLHVPPDLHTHVL
jgi:hypothetical protein